MDVDENNSGSEVDMDTGDNAKGSQWLRVSSSKRCNEVQIMELLESASLKLADPDKIYYLPKLRAHCLKLSSPEDARKFQKECSGDKFTITILHKNFQDRRDRAEDSKTLRINNLSPKVSDKRLAKHIGKLSKKSPKFLEVRPHSGGKMPSIAFVVMETAKDAQKLVEKLRMHKIEGQKVWACKTNSEWNAQGKEDRGAFLKGDSNKVRLQHLPAGIKASEIEEMCSKHGSVEHVTMNRDKGGYYMRCATVTMSSSKAASKVFDKMHQTTVKDCTITTEYFVPSLNMLKIQWFPKSVPMEDVYDFLANAVDERPLRVGMWPSKRDQSKTAATVTFSSYELMRECVNKLNGKKLEGTKVEVKPQARPSMMGRQTRRIRLSNLSRNVTEQDILDQLKEHAQINKPPTNISLRHHLSSGKQTGHALIDLQSHQDAVSAVQNVTMTELKGQKIFVMLNSPKRAAQRHDDLRGKTQSICLVNLHYKTGVPEIKKLCKSYGRVEKVTVLESDKGFPLCVAVVKMNSNKAATKAFDGLHEKMVNNMEIRTVFGEGNQFHKTKRGKKKVFEGENKSKMKVKGKAFSGDSKLAGVSKKLKGMKLKGKGKKKGVKN